MKRLRWKLVVMPILLLMLSACGEKADVSIFIMPPQGLPGEIVEKLDASLQQKVGETTTTDVFSTPIFDIRILMTQIAGGGHGIIILPEEQFKQMARDGGIVILDKMFDPEKYPGGVVEAAEKTESGQVTAKHLYGVPVSGTSWLSDAGYKGPELYAIVHPQAPDLEKSKQVLKVIMEK